MRLAGVQEIGVESDVAVDVQDQSETDLGELRRGHERD